MNRQCCVLRGRRWFGAVDLEVLAMVFGSGRCRRDLRSGRLFRCSWCRALYWCGEGVRWELSAETQSTLFW